jgi:hypothetical protein
MTTHSFFLILRYLPHILTVRMAENIKNKIILAKEQTNHEETGYQQSHL